VVSFCIGGRGMLKPQDPAVLAHGPRRNPTSRRGRLAKGAERKTGQLSSTSEPPLRGDERAAAKRTSVKESRAHNAWGFSSWAVAKVLIPEAWTGCRSPAGRLRNLTLT
jgi:hypothetical protein